MLNDWIRHRGIRGVSDRVQKEYCHRKGNGDAMEVYNGRNKLGIT